MIIDDDRAYLKTIREKIRAGAQALDGIYTLLRGCEDYPYRHQISHRQTDYTPSRASEAVIYISKALEDMDRNTIGKKTGMSAEQLYKTVRESIFQYKPRYDPTGTRKKLIPLEPDAWDRTLGDEQKLEELKIALRDLYGVIKESQERLSEKHKQKIEIERGLIEMFKNSRTSLTLIIIISSLLLISIFDNQVSGKLITSTTFNFQILIGLLLIILISLCLLFKMKKTY